MYDVFNLPDFKFPEGFFWGVATAGHQIDGNNKDCDLFHLEQTPEFYNEPYNSAPSGMACNHWEMYKDDVNLITNLGVQVYRCGVEWSRIEPTEGFFCKEAMDHYIDELSTCKAKGLKIILTLNHFTLPQWFKNLGGISKMENIKYFERYVEYVVPKLAEFVDSWNVFNEFNLGVKNEVCLEKMNYVRYHARGYHIIRKYSKAPISTTHAMVMYCAKRGFDKFDNAMKEYYDWAAHEFFFHAIRTGEIVMPFCDAVYDKDVKDTLDYWGINIYTRTMIDARKESGTGTRYRHKELKLIPVDFSHEEMFPENMIHTLSRFHDKPIVITENGCTCYDDRWRIVYISLYLNALKEAIDMGADVRGYVHWSLMDNYEWGSFIPRFGLYNVDFDTFERTPKKSAAFYREIIENNGFSQAILRKY